jgi:hypothetical protein
VRTGNSPRHDKLDFWAFQFCIRSPLALCNVFLVSALHAPVLEIQDISWNSYRNVTTHQRDKRRPMETGKDFTASHALVRHKKPITVNTYTGLGRGDRSWHLKCVALAQRQKARCGSISRSQPASFIKVPSPSAWNGRS